MEIVFILLKTFLYHCKEGNVLMNYYNDLSKKIRKSNAIIFYLVQ